ncbi:arsenate reductase (glutaredoxin) [Alkalisalibacterium limincola]|uniref:Arsenate reductase n=1 Tax=Alkalisalibacterium limincola TaxID=2699169 RepID=A0A5C8KV69_9GAMM|nr:arsenate reductase (glutaredoxin) [Alkalisalibacterium limincola]TXK65599.1 arsenate reductase (glutaredoxin) [Alkalisalibacterium limincola]
MGKPVIYHNPRCSKSREALALLEAEGVELEVVKYLESPPDSATLRTLLKKLGVGPRDLMRTKEPEYRDLGLDNESLSEAALVAAMVAHPKLIERPVFVNGERAVIGRPPEKVLEIL